MGFGPFRGFFLYLFCYRQREDKFRSHTFGADHIDVLVVCSNDLLYNGKSKTSAFLVFSTGEVGLIETLPDFVQAVFGNSDTGVFHRDENLVVLLCGLDLDKRVIVAELNGVVDQVVKIGRAHV